MTSDDDGPPADGTPADPDDPTIAHNDPGHRGPGNRDRGEPGRDKGEGEGQDERRGQEPDGLEELRGLVRRLEASMTATEEDVSDEIGDRLLPAWKRVTEGEPRWPVSLAVLAAVAMQATLPSRVTFGPRWLLPGLAVVLLVVLFAANPRRINRSSAALRTAGIVLTVTISAANAMSAVRLVTSLVEGTADNDPTHLLLTGAAIWLTNVIAFALWYWELDRGGPVARANATHENPDFLFPQMQSPELAPPHWEPGFVDYLYVSFTNATAFSPTDTLPLSRWTKLTMLTQSAVSLVTVALVIARAVNILK